MVVCWNSAFNKHLFYTIRWTYILPEMVVSGMYFNKLINLVRNTVFTLQEFHYPLTTVLVHMIIKFLLACLVRLIFSCKNRERRVLLDWKEYVISVAPTGVFSGIDIGFSNWGLELIKVSLLVIHTIHRVIVKQNY